MQTTYLDLGLSLARVKELAQITRPDRDQYLIDLLEAATGAATAHPKVFRPYLVAAVVLEQDIDRQQITEADGVKFTNLVGVIASLRSQQHSLDLALSLEVPTGMLAIAPSPLSAPKVRHLGTQSFHTVVHF